MGRRLPPGSRTGGADADRRWLPSATQRLKTRGPSARASGRGIGILRRSRRKGGSPEPRRQHGDDQEARARRAERQTEIQAMAAGEEVAGRRAGDGRHHGAEPVPRLGHPAESRAAGAGCRRSTWRSPPARSSNRTHTSRRAPATAVPSSQRRARSAGPRRNRPTTLSWRSTGASRDGGSGRSASTRPPYRSRSPPNELAPQCDRSGHSGRRTQLALPGAGGPGDRRMGDRRVRRRRAFRDRAPRRRQRLRCGRRPAGARHVRHPDRHPTAMGGKW